MKLHPTETHLLGMIGFYENLIHFNAFSFLGLLLKFNLSTEAITRYRYQFFFSLCIIQTFRCVGKTETKSNQPIFNLYFVQLSIKSFIHLFNIPYFIDFFAASFGIYITNASINFNWNNGKLCIFATKFAQIDIQWNAKRFFHFVDGLTVFRCCCCCSAFESNRTENITAKTALVAVVRNTASHWRSYFIIIIMKCQ